MILAMTSTTVPLPVVFDTADSIVAQKLSQIDGMGQVGRWGGATPAVRVQANPAALNSYGISLERVRAVLNTANAIGPKGEFADAQKAYYITDTDQIFKAADYQRLLVGFNKGAPVRLSDIALVTDSVQDRRNAGLANGEPAVSLVLFKQPNANIIETVDRVYEMLPELRASIPPAMHLQVILDRTSTIRASDHRRGAQPGDLRGAGGVGGLCISTQRLGHLDSQRLGALVIGGHLWRDVPAGLQPGQFVVDGA